MDDFSRHLPQGYFWMVERGLVGFDPFTQLQPWYFLRPECERDVALLQPDLSKSHPGTPRL